MLSYLCQKTVFPALNTSTVKEGSKEHSDLNGHLKTLKNKLASTPWIPKHKPKAITKNIFSDPHIQVPLRASTSNTDLQIH